MTSSFTNLLRSTRISSFPPDSGHSSNTWLYRSRTDAAPNSESSKTEVSRLVPDSPTLESNIINVDEDDTQDVPDVRMSQTVNQGDVERHQLVQASPSNEDIDEDIKRHCPLPHEVTLSQYSNVRNVHLNTTN
jgi:hypothetical protein